MALRMHPVSQSKWKQLAASRHPIDLVGEQPTRTRPDHSRRRKAEHAAIQAQVASIAAPRAEAFR
jgi:hypothetical protein